MASLIAKWRSITGLRYTSSQVVSVDVQAFANHNPSTENGVQKVRFTASVNGGAPFSVDVFDRTLRYPRFSEYSYSRMPGASVNNHYAAIYGYGINVPLSVFPVGNIVITAEAYANNGSTYQLPGSITIYNDHDGVDRRPNNKHIYVDPDLGSDTNDGSEGSPVASIMTALLIGRKNPSGTTSDDMDVHGLTIHLADGLYVGGGSSSYISEDIHTSGDGWVTLVSDGSDARITAHFQPDEIGVVFPNTYLFANGYNSGGNFRIAFFNCKFEDAGLVVRPKVSSPPDHTATVNVSVWIEGGSSYSTAPRVTDHSVRFLERSGDPIAIANDTGNGGIQQRFCTGHYRHHVTNGWLGWTMVMDCYMQHYTAIAFNNGGVETDQGFCNVFLNNQQAYGLSDACVALTDGYTWVTDGAKTNIIVGGIVPAGMAAVVQTGAFVKTTGASTDSFAAALNFLVGSKTLGVYISDPIYPSNSGVFEVVAANIDGSGNEYVIYKNPVAVPAPGHPDRIVGSGSRVTQLPYNQLHPDIIQFSPNSSNFLASDLAAVDLRETQTFYSSGGGLTNVWFVNCSDGNHSQNAPMIMGGSNALRDCGWIHCTFSGRMYTYNTQPHSNNCMINCVFDSTGGFATSPGFYADGCHWIDTSSFAADPAFGTNSSSGAFHEYDISSKPFDMSPDATHSGTGVAIPDVSSAFFFPGAHGVISKGALVNVATQDWLNLTADTVTPVYADGDHLSMSLSINDGSAASPRTVIGPHLSLAIAQSDLQASVAASTSADHLSMSLLQVDPIVEVQVTQTYVFTSSLSMRMGIINPVFNKPIVAVGSSLSLAVQLAEPTVFSDVAVSNKPAWINISLNDPTISAIAEVVADHLTFAISQPDSYMTKVALYRCDHLIMPLTIVDQPQDIFGKADLLAMSIGVFDPSVVISGSVSADHLSAVQAIHDATVDVNVVAEPETLPIQLVLQEPSISVSSSNTSDSLSLSILLSDPSIRISSSVTSDVQELVLSLHDGSIGVAPTIQADSQSLVVTQHEGVMVVDASYSSDQLVLTPSIYDGIADVGSSTTSQALSITLSINEPVVASNKNVTSDLLSMSPVIYDPATSTTVIALASRLDISMDIHEPRIPGGLYDVGDAYTVPFGLTRDRLSGEVFVDVDPLLIEEWRIVFRPQ